MPTITPALTDGRAGADDPVPLAANRSKVFQGSNVLGKGFILTPAEAERLTAESKSNTDVVQPIIGADEVTSLPVIAPQRYVINFGARTLEEACEYAAPMEIVHRLVKPERDKNNRPARRDRWWMFAERAPKLYEAIDGLARVIAMPLVSKAVLPVFLDAGYVYNHKLAIFAYDDDEHFGMLTSAVHWWWAVTRSSPRGETRVTYSPKDAFETLPLPASLAGAAGPAKDLDAHRRTIMAAANQGMTKIYNRVNDPDDNTAEVTELRRLHRELDRAVVDAYGWADLPLDYAHWHTRWGVRHTLTETTSTELLQRLLALNLSRAASAGS